MLRFGNRVEFNQYGMRSERFEPEPVEGECRIIVFGDSVINGGSLSDQSAIATEIWRKELSRTHSGTIVVGNVSAGSWGPGNWLGYAKNFGFFGANLVLLVVSTHDLYDNPKFEPLDPATHPQSPPPLALIEGFARYIPQYVSRYIASRPEAQSLPLSDYGDSAKGSADLGEFLREARLAVPRVIVIQALERSELESGPREGHFLIRQIASMADIAVISSEAVFKQAMAQNGEQFRDNIHLNDAGQATLARLFNTMGNPCPE